jgi:phenylpropionate dioxygenase-like ring-hydroxylating dioxygenase large terminal subunit
MESPTEHDGVHIRRRESVTRDTWDETATLRRLIEFERGRKAPPPGFPAFPDLPGKRYTDPAFYALERQQLWRKSWLFAGHLDEIPEPGCYKLFDSALQPVVILHAQSGGLRAFYNTCRHRGAALVREPYGTANRLVCGYHGWTYDHDGALIALRDERDFVDLDKSCRSLYPVRIETLGKFFFVNFDADARPLLDEFAAFIPQWRQFQFDSLRFVRKDRFELDCNWKIAMEANMEVYHVPSIHPTTVSPLLDHRGNVNTLYAGGHGRMVAPSRALRGQNDSHDGRPDIETVGEIARTCTLSFNLVPNLVSPMSAKGFPIMAFWPTSLNTTTLEISWYGKDWAPAEKPAAWDQYIGFFNDVVGEDTQFGNWIQKAVESYAYDGVPLSYQEARIYHWHQAIDAVIGVERIAQPLRVAPVIDADWMHPRDTERRLQMGLSLNLNTRKH